MKAARADEIADLIERARGSFREQFGREAERIAVAPGRANLIGEHTDYHDGFVFPIAIDRYIVVAAAPEDSSLVYSEDRGLSSPFRAQEVSPGPSRHWDDYARGMAWALRDYGAVPDLETAIISNLPIGSGLSSSAAMEMAFGVLWRDLAGFDIDDLTLAQIGQRAENDFCRMNCGIMDQTASIMGRAHQAMRIDTRRPISVRYASLPAGVSVVVCDTNVRHSHVTSGYNDRRHESEVAARALGVNALRDVGLDQLEAARESMGDIPYRRARHIITENARVNAFEAALATENRLRISALMTAAHESIRDDFEASCAELDWMAEACWAQDVCWGARMTGGGFGGSCVALVEEDHVERFIAGVASEYERRSGREPTFHVCQAVDGARVVAS